MRRDIFGIERDYLPFPLGRFLHVWDKNGVGEGLCDENGVGTGQFRYKKRFLLRFCPINRMRYEKEQKNQEAADSADT